MIVTAGSTNVSVYYYIVQDASGTSPGEPVTGLLFSDIETGGSASYARQGAARVDLTLITLASASAAHSDGGFILVDDTNMPGLYRCDYPDAAFATGVDQVFLSIVVASANNAVAAPILVDITDVNLRDSVRGGMTALPNAAADAAGGLPISDAGGLDLDAMNTNINDIETDTAAMQPLVAKIPLSDGAITWNATALASINAECDTALADYDGPTNAEMVARTLVAASYFDPASDTVATVTTLTGHTPQTGDTYALANGATGFAAIDTVVDAILVDTGTTIPATITTAQNDLDIITGASGVNLLTATQATIDAAATAASIAALNDVAATDIVSSGAITTLAGAVVNVDLVDTCTTNTDMRGTDSALLAASINLTGGAVDTVTTVTNQVTADTTAIAGVTAAATNLSKSAIGIEPGAAITGTLSTTQMTTDLTEATDDHYNGRIIVWTSGVLKNQATDITDYTGATKLLTYTATTEAPANTDTFVII